MGPANPWGVQPRCRVWSTSRLPQRSGCPMRDRFLPGRPVPTGNSVPVQAVSCRQCLSGVPVFPELVAQRPDADPEFLRRVSPVVVHARERFKNQLSFHLP